MKLFVYYEADDGSVQTFDLKGRDKEALAYIAKLVKGLIPAKASLYQVRIIETGQRKINLIKHVREITGLGLKEAKDVAEMHDLGQGPGVVFKGVPFVTAEEYRKGLEAEGATVSVEEV